MPALDVSDITAAVPLAEATLRLLRRVCDESRLSALYEAHRGRGYEKVITFPQMVQMIGDVLLQHGGSGYRVFSKAQETGELTTSLTAAYGKLGRLSIDLSMAFLSESTDALREVFPQAAERPAPKCLRNMRTVIIDGKAIKKVAKRLAPLRGLAGGMLGGRGLVSLDYATGLVIGMHADEDGDANDSRFVPELLPLLREKIADPMLFLGDRGYCDLVRFEEFTSTGRDLFLVRYHPKTKFHRDCSRPRSTGRDDQGRKFIEEWGWMGAETHKLRRYVRRITLQRGGEEDVILVTDLLDEKKFPAAELLDHYLSRWGIERVFQLVTETFGLEGLIGGTPRATIFQFAFCLLLYNVMQTIRGYVAEAQRLPTEDLSLENMFCDVREELTAWVVFQRKGLVTAEEFASLTAGQLETRLRKLFRHEWSKTWIKARNKNPRRPTRRATKRAHNSVFRILAVANGRC